MNLKIVENFADNGGHLHWSVIDTETGETIMSESQQIICDDCGEIDIDYLTCPHCNGNLNIG